MSGLLVIGIGNPDCGDDGIGPMVARLLAGRVGPEAEFSSNGAAICWR